MSIEITLIEEVDLPNYMETIIGVDTYEREAPLLAKFKVSVRCKPQIGDLFFEIREQGNGSPSIDEYYEDQVFNEVQKLLPNSLKPKQRTKLSNDILSFLQTETFKFWSGEEIIFPVAFSENI